MSSAPQSDVTQMDSGRLRIRRLHDVPFTLLSAKWTFTEEQFQTFQSFFEDTLGNGVETFAINLGDTVHDVVFYESNYTFKQLRRVTEVTAVLDILTLIPPYDYSACSMVNIAGVAGGDTFDCYPEGELPGSLLQPHYIVSLTGGTGLTGGWKYGNNPFNNMFGDDFDSYTDGAFTAQAAIGTGLTGNWNVGDGP